MKNTLESTGTTDIVIQFGTQLYTQWIKYIDCTPKTAETYTRAIRQFARYMEANNISRPTTDDIIAYREALKADHKPATVQAYIMSVKIFFKYLEAMGIYPNIADRVKGVKISKNHRKDALTPGQIRQTLGQFDTTTIKGMRDKAIITLMATTGLRCMEVAGADTEDLRNVGGYTVLFIKGKGHDAKDAFVKVPEKTEEAIREYLKARGTKDTALFTSTANRNTAERMTVRSISRICKEAFREVGIDSDRLTAHSLRHSAATLNLRNGGTLESTQQLLRHSNIGTTMIYIDEMKQIDNDSTERIANVIFG